MTALPTRVRKTLRERMIREVIGSGSPYVPAIIWYVDDHPALSWSEVGGMVPANRRSPRAQAITSACFPQRYTQRFEQRPDVLRRVLAGFKQWSGTNQGGYCDTTS
ncbi:hypothetical protein [Nocardia salmonicida]|uniref:hypothetical protein n=1 Tax=Nocardia salmonicida TaxID=53431 RepID=UPI002E27F5B8|nr:hypothetical protein [Nocardia salmonicida]